MNILKNLCSVCVVAESMMAVNTCSRLQHNCDWGRQTSWESDENGIIPEQDRVITQVVILDADKSRYSAW